MLKICLLGSFDARYEGGIIQLPSRHAQSLFAYLVLNGRVSHRREKLARMLWPDSPETTGRENLRHTLWRIRKALPSGPSVDFLLADDFTVAFNESIEHWFDVAVLRRAESCKCADDLVLSLSAYKGELLPGFDDEWVLLEREYLNFVFEHNMARLMAMLPVERRWLDVLEWGERWIAFGQRPEPAYRALMCAHKEKGDMSKVAETYARCIRALEELGLEPSEQTHGLFESLKREGCAMPEREGGSGKVVH